MSKKNNQATKHTTNGFVVNDNLKHIIVFMPSFLGDCINCTPALQLLRQQYPGVTLHLVIRAIANAFESDSDIDCIIDTRKKDGLPGIFKLIKTLKNLQASACVLMTNRLVDAFIAKMAGIPVRVGYDVEMRGKLLTHALNMNRNRHYINRYAYLTNALCNNAFEQMPLVQIESIVDTKFTVRSSGLKIGWCILSKHKLSRHYPASKTAEAIIGLDTALDEVHQFMLGSPVETAEAQMAVELAKATGVQTVESLTGKTTIKELIDIVSSLDLLITVDSAALHIASATQTPIVALHSKGTSPFSLVCPKG
ncbi:MAG: heptosyltransferase-2, partial [Alteromonadaceae bacterium]